MHVSSSSTATTFAFILLLAFKWLLSIATITTHFVHKTTRVDDPLCDIEELRKFFETPCGGCSFDYLENDLKVWRQKFRILCSFHYCLHNSQVLTAGSTLQKGMCSFFANLEENAFKYKKILALFRSFILFYFCFSRAYNTT